MAGLDRSAPLNASTTALRIVDFLIRTEVERKNLFRLHLQTTVRRISPLLIDLAEFESIVLEDMVSLMRAPPHWPWRPLGGFRPCLTRNSMRRNYWLRAAGSRDAYHFARSFTDPGVVVRKPNNPRGRFAFRPYKDALDFSAAVGPCVLCGIGATAVLKLPYELPESVIVSLPGRKLNEVIDHPVFVGRPYAIKRVMADIFDGLPLLVFRAKLLPFEGPWAPMPTAW
jgi:hypothetical protein